MSRVFITTSASARRPKNAAVLTEGSTLFTGSDDYAAAFGNQPTSLEADLLRLAAAVFAADRAIPREPREDIGRQIELSVPVVNVATLIPLGPTLERILRFLSNDGWTLELRQQKGAAERLRSWEDSGGDTLLFSGGLDSLAAALEFGGVGSNLQLVSHRTQNPVTSGAQRRLAEALTERGLVGAHRQFYVSSRSGTELKHDEENSQRTRSFVFLTLGAIVARRTGQRRLIYLAENGQLAIHLPLSSGRIGAFSTHTAHPHVLRTMTDLLSTALGVPLKIENPYVYRTKREVIDSVIGAIPDLLAVATSCWRNSRLRSGVTHCGSCIPCQIRRIAIEHSGVDPTAYDRDLWRERLRDLPWDDVGRRNLMELAQFVSEFSSRSNDELMSTWPELISRDFDASQAIDMYRRFATEAIGVWRRYPEVQGLL